MLEIGSDTISISQPRSLLSRFFDVAYERFPFVHRNVRIGDQGRQLVDDVSGRQAFITPVPGHADLVDDFAVDSERPHPPRDQSLGADLRARAEDSAPVEILDAFLLSQLGTDLDEEFGLQFGEPRKPAAHAARQVVLGQTIRGHHIGKLRVAQLCASSLPVSFQYLNTGLSAACRADC